FRADEFLIAIVQHSLVVAKLESCLRRVLAERELIARGAVPERVRWPRSDPCRAHSLQEPHPVGEAVDHNI
ncbi:MAG: hypothetical protein WBL40_11880, partial [Terrimicrobiaceae bacterium]